MHPKKFSLWLWITALFFVTVGCSLFNWSNRFGEDSAGDILFADDFSDPPSGWGIRNEEGAQVGYFANGLRFLIEKSHLDFWSVAGQEFQDVSIEVDAIKYAGPDNNDFGVICRYQDQNNFYMFVISSDGYYGIAKLKDGQYSMISSDKLQYSEVITQGQAVNHLRVDCVGDRLSLYANGRKLVETRDADFASGDVGLVAGAYQEKGVEILFDNFVVKKPGD